MKKGLLFMVVLVGLLWAETGYAGDMCWTDGHGTYWKTYVTKQDGMSPYKIVTGFHYTPGGYVMPVTGTLQKHPGGTTLRLSLTGTHVYQSSVFDVFFFDAELDPTTKSGTMWYLHKTNTESSADSMSFAKTRCSDLPAY